MSRTGAGWRVVIALLALCVAVHAHLLLAMPHSSSSSALKSLSSMTGLRGMQEWPCTTRKPLPKNHTFAPLGSHHSDVCEISPGLAYVLGRWTQAARLAVRRASDTIFKQHLPPLKAHVEWFEQTQARAVLLVRDVAAAAHASCEVQVHEHRRLSPEQLAVHTAAQLHSLAAWRAGWREAASRLGPDRFLTVEFEQMAAHGRAEAFDRVLRFWGLQRKAAFRDARARLLNRSSHVCAAALRRALHDF